MDLDLFQQSVDLICNHPVISSVASYILIGNALVAYNAYYHTPIYDENGKLIIPPRSERKKLKNNTNTP